MMIVADIDRTLVDAGDEETFECRALFKDLVRRGVLLGLASARSLPSVAQVLPKGYEIASFFICSDGAISFSEAKYNHHVLCRAVLNQPAQVIQRFGDIELSDSSLFVFYDERAHLAVDVALAPLHRPFLSQILQGRTCVERGRGDLGLGGSGALSVGILGSRAKCERAGAHLSTSGGNGTGTRVRVFDEIRIEEDLWWCEVSATDADKGVALAKLLGSGRYSGSAPLIVLGDGSNDVGMALLADIAMCPPWAAESLSAVATVVGDVRSCREFVATILEKMPNWGGGN